MSGLLGQNAMSVVSMDNHAFDLETLVETIRLCALHHKRLFIVLADDLYTYNRPVLREEPENALGLIKDRSRYIKNAIHRASSVDIEVSLKSWRRFCTPRFVDISRRLFLLAARERILLAEIDKRVQIFVARFKDTKDELRHDEIVARCRAYIFEETAMALHLASNYRVGDEYYPGDNAPVLRTVYELLDHGNLYRRLMLKPHDKRFWNVQLGTRGLERTMEWSNTMGHLRL